MSRSLPNLDVLRSAKPHMIDPPENGARIRRASSTHYNKNPRGPGWFRRATRCFDPGAFDRTALPFTKVARPDAALDRRGGELVEFQAVGQHLEESRLLALHVEVGCSDFQRHGIGRLAQRLR